MSLSSSDFKQALNVQSDLAFSRSHLLFFVSKPASDFLNFSFFFILFTQFYSKKARTDPGSATIFKPEASQRSEAQK